MKISALIPARGRPEQLRDSVASLFDTASYPEGVECIIRLDVDDSTVSESLTYLAKYPEHLIRVSLGKRLGYQGLHHYYNECAATASKDSEWLLLWNDDTRMLTKNWDTLLHQCYPFSMQFLRRDITETSDFTLLAMGRTVYNALGHFALNPYNDAYLSHVARYSGTAIVRNDIVFSHEAMVMTEAEDLERGNEGILRFHSKEEIEMRQKDMQAIVSSAYYPDRFLPKGATRVFYEEKLPYEYQLGAVVLENTPFRL